MTGAYSSVIAAMAVVLMFASAVGAEQAEGGGAAAPRTSTLDISADLFAAADRAWGSVPDAPLGPIAPPLFDQGARSFWGGNAQMAYEKSSGRTLFTANAGSSFRRLSQIDDGLRPGYSGAAQLTVPLGRRTRADLQQSLGYGPVNALPFFAVGELGQSSASLPSVDYRLALADQFTSSSRGSLSYSLSRRGTLTGSVGLEYSEQPASNSSAGATNFRRWDVSGRYSYRLTRYASWYAGYGRTENVVARTVGIGSLYTPQLHSIDAGVAYDRPLSFSRRTRVSVQLGSSIVQDAVNASREWRASGSAGLRHEIGRSWLAQLSYLRDSRFVPAFVEPILNDAVTVQVGGRLATKSNLNFLANYTTGSVGVSSGSNGYRGTSASASYRYAVLRQVAAYVEYFLFDFNFGSGVQLADTFFTGSRRHGVRVGVSVGTGLWGTRRRVAPIGNGESAQ